MKLRDARLCIDCDEVYEAEGTYARCPSCGSESFALISRWIPTLNQSESWLNERQRRGVVVSTGLTTVEEDSYREEIQMLIKQYGKEAVTKALMQALKEEIALACPEQ